MALFIGCPSSASDWNLPPAKPRPTDACEYGSVWFRPDNPEGDDWVSNDKKRRYLLQRASESLDRYPLWRVDRREDAYWVFGVSHRLDRKPSDAYSWNRKLSDVYSLDRKPSDVYKMSLSAELRLERDVFVVKIVYPLFPHRPTMGNSYLSVWSERLPNAEGLNAFVDDGLDRIWQQEAERFEALCSARERFVREGLKDVEELRKQLVEEMQQLRRRQAAEPGKRIDVTIEPDGRGQRQDISITPERKAGEH
jgi:hypothetical protein